MELGVWLALPQIAYYPPSLPVFSDHAIEDEHVMPLVRRVKSTPDLDAFEKYRDTPPFSIVILLQTYALLLAESSTYTTN